MNKVIKACIALAAFTAFVVLPATASATNDPHLYSGTSETLSPSHASPVAISAVNVGDTLMTEPGGSGVLVRCTTAHMGGNLETNEPTAAGGAKVEGTITEATFLSPAHGNECSGSLGTVLVTPSVAGSNPLPWCLRSTATMKTDEFQVRGGGCTEESRPITFQLHVTSLGLTCNYQRTTAITGTYTTHPSAATLTISKVPFERHNSSAFCPAGGDLDMSFELKTAKGSVYIKNHDGK